MELYSFIPGNSPYSSFLSPPPLPYLYSPPQSYVHWTQTPDSHIYTANLPGVRKEEIRVEVEDGRYLVIRTDLLEEEEDELRGEEQRLRSFERKFRLPERVEVDRISAGYEDGVLTVRVPRRQRVPDVVVDLGVVEDARVARAA